MKWLLIIYAMAYSLHAMPQNITTKDFNDLKRSNKYFYYEVNLEDKQKARDAAKANLIKLINDFYSKNPIKKGIVDAEDLKDVLFIEMDRNGIMKVMAYIEKDKLSESETIKSDSISEVIKTSHQILSSEPVDQANETNTISKPSDCHEKAMAVAEPACKLEEWQQKIISDICHTTSANDLYTELSSLKSQYKLKRIGVSGECNNIPDSYWCIYDSGKNIIAILSPGEHTRFNYLTRANDTLDKYTSQGYKGIWFQLSK